MTEMLILFHSTPVNSKESAAALETWQQLTGPLMGFAQTGIALHLLLCVVYVCLQIAFDFDCVVVCVQGPSTATTSPITAELFRCPRRLFFATSSC